MGRYPDAADQALIDAFAALTSPNEIKAFLRDILTMAEIKEAANRFQIAKTLWTTDKTYLEIAAKFQTSTTTVTRVARWLKSKKYGGYRIVLNRMYPKNKS